MPIDKKLINRKILLINRDLKELRKLSHLPLEEYLSKLEYEAVAERYLERIIGRMIDINYHLLTEGANITPLDYYGSFADLGKYGYLPQKFSRDLANAAGLRNRLAHEYDEIDEKKVYQAVKKSLKDVPKYLKSILIFLDKDPSKKKLF
jgi:uncharacterized protein YutE (UPF0331/DUF86 family)